MLRCLLLVRSQGFSEKLCQDGANGARCLSRVQLLPYCHQGTPDGSAGVADPKKSTHSLSCGICSRDSNGIAASGHVLQNTLLTAQENAGKATSNATVLAALSRNKIQTAEPDIAENCAVGTGARGSSMVHPSSCCSLHQYTDESTAAAHPSRLSTYGTMAYIGTEVTPQALWLVLTLI